jgi:asparagine synthase (glutamine-hydrolysing)
MYWRSKLIKHRTFKEQELKYLSPELEKEVSPEGIELKATQNAELSRGEFLAGGTRYYLEQRVPNFYANGISMYNDTTQWRSPFHRIDWLKQIWNISDNWKLGSNWHRLAIKRNFPMLLNFSEEKGFMQDRMLSKAPPFYWTEAMQRVKYKTYDLSGGWYRDKKIREIILDNLDCLDDICQKPLPEKILDDHVRDGNRVKAISFLLTIVNFKQALRNG